MDILSLKKSLKSIKYSLKSLLLEEKRKKLYYVSSYHLSENIDEAKRFETNEDKDGYIYEIIKESSNEF